MSKDSNIERDVTSESIASFMTVKLMTSDTSNAIKRAILTVRPTTLLLGLENKYDVDLMEMFRGFGG